MTVWMLILALCKAPFECALPVWTDTALQIETHITIADSTAVHCIYVIHKNGILETTKHTRGRCGAN